PINEDIDIGYKVSSWKQFIFIGRKKIARVSQSYRETIKQSLEKQEGFVEPIKIDLMHNPTSDQITVKIYPVRVYPEDMIKHCENFFSLFSAEIKEKNIVKNLKPVVEPREGHLALLSASGLINGDIDDDISIKGIVFQERREIEEEEFNDLGEEVAKKITTTYTPKIRFKILERNSIIREVI
ncbi:MAG: hypothetical protein ACP5OE_08705, partial [Thermodesulfobium sp.]